MTSLVSVEHWLVTDKNCNDVMPDNDSQPRALRLPAIVRDPSGQWYQLSHSDSTFGSLLLTRFFFCSTRFITNKGETKRKLEVRREG